ncbi:MAG: PTS sugar transporter subunit IIB [Holdemanella sp.]|nr:PTS sugar transporter subunit IIB [Holdemanella sp.]
MEQKVLLCCAGGMSTGLLMKKMEKYWASLGIDLKVHATGVNSAEKYFDQYDVILVGPQMRFMVDTLRKKTDKPVEVIPTLTYGMQKCDEMKALVDKLYEQIKK